MIVNLNVRVLTNKAIFVQYLEDGKAKDAAFTDWLLFVEWLAKTVDVDYSTGELKSGIAWA